MVKLWLLRSDELQKEVELSGWHHFFGDTKVLQSIYEWGVPHFSLTLKLGYN